MASISTTTTWLYRGKVCTESGKSGNCILQRRVKCGFPIRTLHVGIASGDRSLRHCIKCKKENEDDASEGAKKSEQGYEYVTVERHPYYSYMDSTSGKLEPASGARASIPGEDYWPEGTSSRVRAARAPQPAGESSSFPSYGKNPGSRRKKNRKATEENVIVDTNDEVSDSEDSSEEEENDSSDGFVVYNNEFEREEEETGFELDKKLGRPHPFIDPTKKKQIEKTLTADESWWNWGKPEKEQWSRWQRRRPDVETVFLKAMAETGQVKLYGEEPTLTETFLYRARRHLFKEERLQAERERLAKEEETGFELDKKLGRPHPFIDPTKKKQIEKTLTADESWWNWGKPEKEQWSRWQRRRPDVETVFLKAMAETGQVKLYGEEPTLTETFLYRARRHLFKEERLQAERERLAKEGPMAFYSEWVKAWKRDTSREAVQKHFEETGEDENTQLIEMFSHQTDREYRIMMGTDIRIKRDPLAMRMREDQIKQIWGGDPVYPTINYIQDPNAVMDFRGPDFHEPTPNMLSYLKENGKVISREMHEALLAKDKTEQLEVPDIDDAMAQAVDIGENDDEEEDADVEKVDEKVPRNWSVLKSTPELRNAKPKLKKEGRMSLDEAVDDSENLTDFLMDFDEESQETDP